MDTATLQSDLKKWLAYNFPNATSDQQLKGVVEELGELCHADLKSEQGIRGYNNKEKTMHKMKDAIGDLVIFLINYCNVKEISFTECLNLAYFEIKKRDWIKNPDGNKINSKTKVEG